MTLRLQDADVFSLGIVAVLLLMSVASVAVAIDRWRTYRRATRQSRRYAADLAQRLERGDLQGAVEAAQGPAVQQSHLARVLAAGLEEWQQHPDNGGGAASAAREALRQEASLCLAEMRRGLSALATIGSTAPFVGLLGTTYGILKAFHDIAATGSGGYAAIAGSISEALITTALGLFVAIPAVWAYNTFSGRVETFGVELDRSGYELVRRLGKVQG